MTGEIRNPAKLPTNLNPAEKEFARCLAEGKPCIVGNGKLPGPEERIESGDNANVVRGEVIRFFAYGGSEENPVLGPAIILHGAWISGFLNLTHANIPYVLMFGDCHFDDLMRMQQVECAALYLNGSHLAQGLFADELTTKGSVNLRNSFSAEGEVRLMGANIGGNLNCQGGKFRNADGDALCADDLTTQGNVRLSENFSAKGSVRLLSANIGGSLDCAGGEFHNPGRNALWADGLTTKGSVNLRNSFSAEGVVRLVGANIGVNLDCTGGKFNNSDGYALAADGLMTKGDIILRNGFSAKGEVRLMGANIGGDLDCSGGKFHNPDGDGHALSADKLTTKRDVNLGDGFSAEGEVRLLGANVGGNLDCEGGKFNNSDGRALDVDNGNISGVLFWRGVTCKGDVNLAHARVDVLADDSASWNSCKVVLNGFTYNRFFNPMDAQSRIDWLAKRPDGMEFSPLPYEQAAKVLFGMGHSAEAWGILHEKRRLEREHKQAPWWQRVWGQWIDALTDFVYRPWRTVGWTAGIVLTGAMLFWAADHCKRIVPHQPIVLAKEEYQKAREAGCHPFDAARAAVPDYPGFNPLMFSLDVFVPLFNLHQESYWAPNSSKGDFFRWLTRGKGEFEGWWLLTAWYWIEIMAGWLLSSLLLLSVTGLLRPRIGGGD